MSARQVSTGCIDTDGIQARLQVRKPADAVAAQGAAATAAQQPHDEGNDYQEPPTWVTESGRRPAPVPVAKPQYLETRVVARDPGRRYLEESGIKQHNRLSQQLLESKPQAIEHLRATPTSKVAGVAAFRLHASHRLAGMGLPVLQTLACTARQSVRRLRFRAFRRKQQFFSQVTRELTAGDPSTVIVWGDANFRHNSRGGPPTPTKGLQRFLAPRCRFFSVDEYRSSALCSACNRRMHGLQLPDPDDGHILPESYTLRRCEHEECARGIWERDQTAACNLLVLFARWFMSQAKPPPFVRGQPVPEAAVNAL